MNNFELLTKYGKIAFYMRLSISDGDICEKDESNSIENQRLLLPEFVSRSIKKSLDNADESDRFESFENAYFETITEYIDDGFSGTNFDRPAFRQMIEDCKARKINTIIVKDTSRLGRDFIEVGDYMEQIFPLLGIRFIAVNNGFDSEKSDNTSIGLETSIINLVNSEYSKDLSRKVKSSRKTLWKSGIPTAGQAPFGYLVVNKKYVIDTETAPIVRLIFQKAVAGENSRNIADHLNEQRVPTPGKFARNRSDKMGKTRVVHDEECLWDIGMVRHILRNYSYTGCMVHGKYKSVAVGSKRKRLVDKSERVILENTHESIVTIDEWRKAQFAVRKVSKPFCRISSEFVLSGKARCGNCGLAMEYSDKGEAVVFCGHAQNVGKASKCCREKYDADRIVEVAVSELKRKVELLESAVEKLQKSFSECADISALKSRIEMLKNENLRLYEAYAEGDINCNDYILNKNKIMDRISELEQRLDQAEIDAEKNKSLICEIKSILDKFHEATSSSMSESTISREIIGTMIDSVIIYDNDNIDVNLSFDNIINKLKFE